MYNDGLTFPISSFFIYDDVKINSITDIKNRNFHALMSGFTDKDEKLKKDILQSVKGEVGYILIPSLLNHFPELIQSKIKFTAADFTSEYIRDQIRFNIIFNNFRVDFDKVESALNDLHKIAIFNKEEFYQNLFVLLYKSFYVSVSHLINFADERGGELHLDFARDFKKFDEYLIELNADIPSKIRKYDFKKNYVETVFNVFSTNDVEEIKISSVDILQHMPNARKKTVKDLLKRTFKVNPNVTANERNKLFKPLYIEIIFAVSGRVQDFRGTENALTKEIKFFLSDF